MFSCHVLLECSGFHSFEHGRFSIMSCVYHTLRHRWLRGLTRKAFLGGSIFQTPQMVGRCRGLRRLGPHGHHFC